MIKDILFENILFYVCMFIIFFPPAYGLFIIVLDKLIVYYSNKKLF
jgi:hypothetical protein